MGSTNVSRQDLCDVCRSFIEVHIAHEAHLFDAVWAAFWQAAGCRDLTDLADHVIFVSETGEVNALGTVGSASAAALDVFHVTTTLSCAAALLMARDNRRVPLDRAHVANAVRSEAIRLHVPERIAGLLEEHALDLLGSLFGLSYRRGFDRDRTSTEPDDVPADRSVRLYIDRVFPNSDSVIVARLCDGFGEVRVGECSSTEADTLAKETSYDLVVDELRHVLVIRPNGEMKEHAIGKMGRAVRVLLWMTLSHVGFTIRYEDVYETIHSLRVPDAARLAALVYQYRDRLQKLLGTGLAAAARKASGPTGKRKAAGKQPRRAPGATVVVRMLKGDGVRTYFVPAEGWTFCWIRRSRNPEESELLRAR